MAANFTYVPISTTTLTSATGTVTFSSIPSTYKDLVVVMNAGGSVANAGVGMRFNSDTGTNYSQTRISGNGTAAASARYSNVSSAYVQSSIGPTTTIDGNTIINIMNYSNSTTYKTALARNNYAASGTEAIVNLWRSTSAITQIDLLMLSGTFNTGSTFTLYGISGA